MAENPLKLPKLGLGTWPMKPAETKNTVLKAIEIGYRFINTAQTYRNEEGVGAALAENTIDRNELIIATKVWPSNYAPQKFIPSVIESRKKLQVGIIDLLYLHWPYHYPLPILYKPNPTVKLLSQTIDKGLTKFIGVSNFNAKQFNNAQALIENRIVANQCKMHPKFQQKKLIKYCNEQSVLFIGYSPLARKGVYNIPVLKEIADKHQATVSQVTLAWEISKNVIPIPKASSEAHLADNFKALEIELDELDIAKIDKL